MIKMLLTKCAVRILLGLLLASVNMTASAITVSELQQANKVKVRTWIEPQEDIITKQQVNLQIEIATDTGFRAGTRIGHFEVKDAIVLKREKFALNSTRREKDKDWIVQQWTVVIYPQRPGLFDIPAIPLTISIAGEELNVIVGEIKSNPISFYASIPNKLQDKQNWVVTTRFDVHESFNKPIDKLKPGDALIRTISMSADDLPAMMLPAVTIRNISNTAVYQKPALLKDKVNRGEYLANRTVEITYIFEKPGDFKLAEEKFYWWDLNSNSVQSIVLPEYNLNVINIAETQNKSGETILFEDKKSKGYLFWIKRAGIVVFIVPVILGIFLIVRLFVTRKKTSHSRHDTEAKLRKMFIQACRAGDAENAIYLFYRWLDHYGGTQFSGSVRKQLIELDKVKLIEEFDLIMKSIYTDEITNKIDLEAFGKNLFNKMKSLNRQGRLKSHRVELKLNS